MAPRIITNYICKNLVNYRKCGLVEHTVICPYCIPEVKPDGTICSRLAFGSHCECPHYKADTKRETLKSLLVIKMELDKLILNVEHNKED